MQQKLPIEACKEAVLETLTADPRARLVITAPTGSGKSTQVPRWGLALTSRRIVVIEPRRVACKTLAARVAELEGVTLGTRVGYAVRDDVRTSRETRIVFMTPGIALRRMTEVLASDLVIVDELHERGMEVDLIVALLRERLDSPLVVMSATLEAERVADYLGGEHVRAEGRTFPVAVEHIAASALLPDRKDLGQRVDAAIARALDAEGDILVFLPGKGEIAEQRERLRSHDADVLALHGGLSLEEQGRAFRPSARRKIVLSTNVAETSVTVPGVGIVIDSGLVRRTRYHRGRGFLTLTPIAADSAEQRAGRAGRTGPGLCLRLWSEAARLEPGTPPEIRRESLLPLVLATAACDARVDGLSFLDAPTDYALAAALEEAQALGAIDDTQALTMAGRELFGLPLDAPLGRLLVEARRRGTLIDAIDLVSALAVGRPMFSGPPSPHDDDDPRAAGCDMTALIHVVREGNASGRQASGAMAKVSRAALSEARRHRRRLRKAFDVHGPAVEPFDRESLARTALAADPRCAHVPRERRGRVTWSNGGTEIELAKESAAHLAERRDALVVFETRALGTSARKTKIIATSASPIRLSWMVKEGLGRERVARITDEDGEAVAVIERVFARKVIGKRVAVPEGALARAAVAKLILEGKLLGAAAAQIGPRLTDLRLAERLAARGLIEATTSEGATPDTDEAWLAARLTSLGVESMADVELLSPEDVLPDALPWVVASVLERELPKMVSTAEARYAVEIDVGAGEVMLRFREGKRGAVPRRSSLPGFLGFKVRVDTGRGLSTVR